MTVNLDVDVTSCPHRSRCLLSEAMLGPRLVFCLVLLLRAAEAPVTTSARATESFVPARPNVRGTNSAAQRSGPLLPAPLSCSGRAAHHKQAIGDAPIC